MPPVTADDAGRFVIVWSSWQANWNVQGQRFSPILPVELMDLAIE